ncbi:MAG: SUMF1/EgtB/PvdO family nonheme iron enzyme, partial [Chitinispirillaceae bacterium]|nr:SUMF1/EgtB/PvdO family nonheme iron enzyme [Chitinispirillaceae bacterium]
TDFYWNKNYRPYPATAEDTTEITAHVLWGPRNNVNTSDPNFGVKEGAATKTPNSYGLYDMLGSLSEWTQAGEVLFTGEAVADSKPTTSPGDTLFVLRGGNWSNNASFIRSSCRSTSFGNYSYFVQGFRTVKEVR